MKKTIGILKWFGGFNSKTGKENDYGFIQLHNNEDVFVHISDFKFDLQQYELHEGTPLTLVIEVDKRSNRKKARHVNHLAQELQQVIASDDADAYENICDEIAWFLAALKLYQKTLLEFIPNEVKQHPKIFPFLKDIEKIPILVSQYQELRQEEVLKDIQFYLQENIDIYVNIPTDMLLLPDLFYILDNTKRVEILVKAYESTSEEKYIQDIQSYLRQNLDHRTYLPQKILLHAQIFPFLQPDQQLNLLIDQAKTAEQLNMNIVDTIVDILRVAPSLQSTLPLYLMSEKKIFELLEPEFRFEVALSRLEDAEDEQNLQIMVTAIKAKSKLVNKLPKDLKKLPLFFDYLNPEDRLKTLLQRFDHHPEESILDELSKLVTKHTDLNTKLPPSIHGYPKIFPLLDLSDQFNYLVASVLDGATDSLEKLVVFISNNQSLVTQLPHELRIIEDFFVYLEIDEQLSTLIWYWNKTADQETLSRIRKMIATNPTNIGLVSRLPDALKVDERIIPYTLAFIKSCDISIESLAPSARKHPMLIHFNHPLTQVNLIWQDLQSGEMKAWHSLSWKARILCVYRATYEDIYLYDQLPEVAQEQNLLVQFALLLHWGRYNPSNSSRAFKKGHDCLQNYVIEKAWQSSEPLDLEPLLPNCMPGVVAYCEGREWFTDEDKENKAHRASRVFCPRYRSSCEFITIQNIEIYHPMRVKEKENEEKRTPERVIGAHIYPVGQLPWQYWSIHELLLACNVTPRLDDIRRPITYVNKLSGWINRLNDIRERMKCSNCETIMKPNNKYAKSLARYTTTVVNCVHGKPHDTNVYLNHCWGCEAQIIDSRESKIQVEGYYLCISCGSGPQKIQHYQQGDICPNCGSFEMQTHDEIGRRIECQSCKHAIYTPPEHKLTGQEIDKSQRISLLKELMSLSQ